MAVVLPPAARAPNVSDYELSQVQSGLVVPVNALLTFARGLQNGSTSESISVASATSAAGFKAILGPATYWTVNFPGGVQSMNSVVFDTVTTASQVATFQWCAPFAGSVIGLSQVLNNVIGTAVCGVSFSKNGTSQATLNVTSPTLSGATTYAKGLYTFAAGDVLSMRINFDTAAVSVSVTAFLVVEMAA